MFRKIFTITIPVIFCALSMVAQRPQKVYHIGKTSYENSEYIRAIEYLTLAINAKKSKFDDAYLYRGRSYIRMGQKKEAVGDFTIATQLIPNNIEAPLASSRLLYELQNYSQSLQYATITLDRDTSNFEAMKLQSLTLAFTGSAESALMVADAAAEIKIDAELLYAKALASDSLGLTDYAIAYYKESIKKNRSFKPAYHALGKLFVRNGLYKNGIETFSMASKQFNDDESFYYRSLIHRKLGNKQSQIVDIAKRLTLNSAQIHLYYDRAQLFKDLDLLQNALADINIYLKWDSLSSTAWFLKAQIVNDLLMKEQAIKSYKKVLKLTENPVNRRTAENAIFKLKKEDAPPIIEIKTDNETSTQVIPVSDSQKILIIKGSATDNNEITSIKINNIQTDFGYLQNNRYVFKASINTDSTQLIKVEAIDIYNNKASKTYSIIKTNPKKRRIILTSPALSPDNTIKTNTAQLKVAGYFEKEASFKNIKINGKVVQSTFRNDKYYFTDRLDIENTDTLNIIAEDTYSNMIRFDYPIHKDNTISNRTSAMGKTYIIIIAADSINGEILPTIRNHRDSLINAYSKFAIDSLIVRSGQTKEQLERDLLFNIPKMLEQNRIDAALIHYLGAGISEPNFSYLITNGDSKKRYTTVNTSIFRTAMNSLDNIPYKTLITETIPIGKNVARAVDSCNCGPCTQVDRFPDEGVFALSIAVKNWFTYKSPLLKALQKSISEKQHCFSPSIITKENTRKHIFGGVINNSSKIFPIVLYRKSLIKE